MKEIAERIEREIIKEARQDAIKLICPHGWGNCEDCLNHVACIKGAYHPEIVSVIAKKEMRGPWYTNLDEMSYDERMSYYYKNPVQGLHHKEAFPLTQITVPGGGSKSKTAKKGKGNKKTVYVWEET